MPDLPEHEVGHVRSDDGTLIGFRKLGAGPALVLIHGSFAEGSEYLPLAEALSSDFTVWVVDSRGRGLSGPIPADFGAHTIASDHQSVVDAAGGQAILFGHSFGATSVLLSAATVQGVTGVVAYEPPLPLRGPLAGAEIDRYQASLDAGEVDEAVVRAFTHIVGESQENVDQLRTTPLWEAMTSIAPTFTPEVRLVDGLDRPLDLVAEIARPVLGIRGGQSPEYLRHSSAAVAEAAADGTLVEMREMDHLGHLSDPVGLAERVASWHRTNVTT